MPPARPGRRSTRRSTTCWRSPKCISAADLAADGTRVLSEASTQAMQQPQASCPEPELLGDRWGLGWFLRTGPGPVVIGHDGNTIGETACLRLIPERNVAWALMMNLSGQNWVSMELAQELIDPWFGTVSLPGAARTQRRPRCHTHRASRRRVPEHRFPADRQRRRRGPGG